MSPRGRLGLAAAYAAATFLAFPQPLGEGVLDLGLVFGFVAPALLAGTLRGLPPRRAALAGFGAGLAAHAAVLHWIYVVTVQHGNAAPPLGVLAVLALASYVALFGAAFGAGGAWLNRRAADGPFALALLWVVLDWLRSFVLTGFPWATLGYALHADRPLLGLVPWTGVYGLSGAAALGGFGALALLTGRARSGAAALGVLAALHAAGALALARERWPDAGSVRVGIVQGNIDQDVKWSPEWGEVTLARYEALTRRAAARGAELVLWPETAVPGSPDVDAGLRGRLAALARETGATLVVGGVGVDRVHGAGGEPLGARFYDSAYVVDREGAFLTRYDKTHLVPFGEYVPLRDLIGRFVEAIATGVASGDVSAGARPRALRLPRPGGGELRAGVPICYELIFPDLVRRFPGDGAQLLLGITNDAWYGDTGAPHQFLAISALRAAETRTAMARAANTGVSARIDPRGRVSQRTPVFEEAVLVEELPLRDPAARPTFYVRHGDVFAKLCGLALAGVCAGAARRGRRAGPPGKDA